MQAAERVVKNTGFLYARMGITVFISLYATRLILNSLGAGDFGIFNVVGGCIAMLTFLNNAMATATQRFMSYAQGEGNADKQRDIFNVSIFLHLIIGFLVILLLEGFGYFLFKGILRIDPERLYATKTIYHFMVVSTFFTIVSVPYDAVINARENMFFVAILGIVESILKLGIAIFVTVILSDKLIWYGLLMAALSVFLLIVHFIYCHNRYEEVEFNIRKYFRKSLFKEMSSFAGWSFMGSSSSMIANYGQGIVINMFFGTVVNAAQGIAGQVSGQLGAFASTMLKALNPLIVKSEGAGDRNLMLKASLAGSKISFFLLMVFYVPVILEMPFIFHLWLKKVPEFTIIFCRLLLIRNLIEQLFLPIASSIGAVGNIKKFQIFNLILNFLPLIFSYVLFSLGYPAYYLYIVFIIYSIFSAGIILSFAKKECGLSISYFFSEILNRCVSSFIVTIILSSVPLFTINEGFTRLILVFSISVIIFFISVWFIGCTRDERSEILTLRMNMI